MYPVTQEFNTKIKLKDREVIGKVQIDYTDPFLDQSIEVEVNEQANISYQKHVHDGVSNPVAKIFSLDGSCVLDGTYKLAPTNENEYLNQMGWWGKQLSNAASLYSVPYPTLTIRFVNRVIHTLKVIGDSKRKEYPVDFIINLYDKENALLYQEVVTNNNQVNWNKIINPVNQVTSMDLVITKWSHPFRQVKILEFFTSLQEIYEDGTGLMTLTLLEEMEINSGKLAFGNICSNEITIQLDNSSRKFHAGNINSPLYNMLKPNRRIKAWLGVPKDNGNEFVPLGIFWSGDWDAPEDGIYAKTIGKDRLEFLKGMSYSTDGVIADISLYDLIIDVFTKADLEPKDYIVDNGLQDYIIPFVLYNNEGVTNVLRHIAQACLGNIYCDRHGIIRVESGKQQLSDVYNISVNEESSISFYNQVINGILDPTHKYAILDGSWALNGDTMLWPVDEQDGLELGWYSNQLSDINGYFIQPYPTLTLEFLSKAISSVKVIGDSKKEEYPVDFDIKVYDGLNNILSHQIITNNQNVSSEISIPENPTNATKIELIIKKWSHFGRQAKIIEFKDIPYRLEITPVDYFKKNNPSRYEEVVNHIEMVLKPIDSDGKKMPEIKLQVQDVDSIVEHGKKPYVFPNNPLIQTEQLGNEIINKILQNQKQSNRNLSLDWRGNPALMLGNELTIVDSLQRNNYRVIRQILDYDGGLRSKMDARRVIV